MRVVGESHYQPALAQMRKQCVPGVEGRPSFPVALVPEPENAFDVNAIAVISAAGHVGYLPRDDARRYGPTLRALVGAGFDGASCVGLLNGGRRDQPSLGVTLCIAYPEDCELHLGLRAADGKPTTGRVRGTHYTDYIHEVKDLRRHGDEDAAERLLLELVDATEEEARETGAGVAPWLYEQLGIIYRKRKDRDAEIAILERFARAPHAPGAGPRKLAERLQKARALPIV
jgi:hypothetical protein